MQSIRTAVFTRTTGFVAVFICAQLAYGEEYSSPAEAGYVAGDPLPEASGYAMNGLDPCSEWEATGLFWAGPYAKYSEFGFGYRCWHGYDGYLPLFYGTTELLALFRDVRHPSTDPVPPPRFTGDYDAGITLTLGAQLTESYRIEGTYMGPFEWSGATTVGANLATFNSALDYGDITLRHRVLMPPGPYETSFLVGIRLMDIDDQLNYLGVTTTTNNELIGLQAGVLSQFLVNGRCWIDWELKGAINNNQVTRVGLATTDVTSFTGETSLVLNYQFLPSMTLRMGYRGMWLTGLALAEENVNNPLVIDHSGEIVYHGLNFGVTWTR